ncbi:hypothetical protein FGG44_gp57 [Mycobacterium phage MacnCheese]|uniref:Uncharacterized protein n=1 Tax=Mycobacterium phage MacnCheese TaxID=2927982 RepID=I6WIL3_9CAUD|nr:hypothetical protein FGG44_gp57 [Mycobacterium phage MacnCheese]AFN37748.1 hypothetical protein MACNCHEESE_57 [Mycobacterium phage MacnCheese]
MPELTGPQRPWWADRDAVQFWCEQQQFETTLAYFDGLTNAIEHQIAYAAADPAAAAQASLQALDLLWYRTKVVEAWGGEAVRSLPEPLPFQAGDPAHVMICACSHPYTDHSDVGCSHCPHCNGFKYSHDDEGVSNGR